MSVTPDDVLRFWFGEGDRDDPEVGKRQGELWWSAEPETDREIGLRFGATLERASAGELDDWASTPQARLALIIVLDQFSRNIHRGTPAAFAQDAKARASTFEGLAAGEDTRLALLERAFFYLPLEHAEDIELQHRCVACFERLRDEADEKQHPLTEYYLDYAIRHRDIIERFGRFPHRNAILGRQSTDEELAFLQQPGSSF